MKIYESEVLSESSNKEPGTIMIVNKNGMKVSCSEGVLLVKKIQFPNGKPLTIEQYINGKDIEVDYNISIIWKEIYYILSRILFWQNNDFVTTSNNNCFLGPVKS